MTFDLLAALLFYAFVASITPGPNNLMLMASGANFGFRRTVPHMLGVALGFVFLALMVGLGLAGLFLAFPASHTVLKAVSVAYLLWLAWKIANAAPARAEAAAGRPFAFLQAAAFQWVNPKAWAMALTAVTASAGPEPGKRRGGGLCFRRGQPALGRHLGGRWPATGTAPDQSAPAGGIQLDYGGAARGLALPGALARLRLAELHLARRGVI